MLGTLVKAIALLLCLSSLFGGCAQWRTGGVYKGTLRESRTVSGLDPVREPRFADRLAAAKIRGKYLMDYLVKSGDITVYVDNGVATLSGTAPSYRSRRRAIDLASETQGIRKVVARVKIIRSL